MVGGINLGGTIDPVYNAVSVVELAIEKGAALVLMPVSARNQLNNLSWPPWSMSCTTGTRGMRC